MDFPEPTGISRIMIERARQREKWSESHDDTHDQGEMLLNAMELCAISLPAKHPRNPVMGVRDEWRLCAHHEGNRTRCLTIAGALIAAEIDRLERNDG